MQTWKPVPHTPPPPPPPHIGHHRQLGNDLKDTVPRTNVLSSLGNLATHKHNILVSVQSDLNPVVEKSSQGSQRESCDKYSNEAILDHKFKVLWEKAELVIVREVIVPLPASVNSSVVSLLVAEALPELLSNGQAQLHAVVEDLFAKQDNDQLDGELQEAAVGRALV